MKRLQSVNRERGVALIIAMLLVLVLSTLVAAVLLVTSTEGWSTMNYRFMVQSRYAAEAGAQATINWLSSSYTPPTTSTFSSYNMTTYPVQCASTTNCATVGAPVVLSAMSGVASNYPDSTQSSAFYAALYNQTVPYPAGTGTVTYSTYATLLRMAQVSSVSWMGTGGGLVQTWQITSQGTITGKPNSVVQVIETVENTTTPIFTAGVEGIGSGCKVTTTADNGLPPVDFTSGCQTNTGKSGPCTDSFNSNSGPYGSTNNQTSGGNIATNGFVNLGGGTFDGTISTSLSKAVGTSCPTDGVENAGTNGGVNLVSTLSAPCPWGCSSCGSTACYPPGVTPVTTNQTLSTTSCGSSGTISGCTMHSPSTTTIYDNNVKTSVNQYNLAPGTYGNITIDGADVVYLQAGGTYNINSINFPTSGSNGDGQLVINNTGCSGSGCNVTLNLTGAGTLPQEGDQNNNNVPTVIFSAGYSGFNLCKNSLPGNPGTLTTADCDNNPVGNGNPTNNPISGIPSELQIVYGGSALIRVGGSPNSWVMYAPQAPFLQPGAAVGLYGSIVCNSFVDSSSSPFHFDNALQGSAVQVNGLKLVAFTWSKY